MTINKIIDTPIIINSYNGRALITNGFVTKNCVRQYDGTLWALAADRSNELHLLRSTDNGFSWIVARQGVQTQLDMRNSAALTADGQCAVLVIDERYRLLDIYMGWMDIADDFFIDRSRFDLDDVIGDTPTSELVETDVHHGLFDISHNHEQIFCVSVALSDNDIQVTRFSPRSTAVSSPTTHNPSGSTYALFSSCVDKDGHLDIIFAAVDTGRFVRHIRFDSSDLTFSAEHEVKELTATSVPRDLSIARDGLGTLCAVYGDTDNANTKSTFHYATSIDNGATWDDNTLARSATHTVFVDSITSDYMNRCSVIGGSRGGFMLSYVDVNSVGIAKTYVRQLTTSDDGATYDVGSEIEAFTSEAAGNKIVGLRWFHPTDIKLLDISDPGLIRAAYQVGEGNDDAMDDSIPVNIGQELLFASAFPSSLTSEASIHSIDDADSVSLRVLVDIHAGPNSNVDFYAAGFTGGFTERYEAAFDKIGTSARLLQFEPKTDNYLSDRSAYDEPTEYEETILFDPVTYSFPSPALDRDTTIERIEQDVRKVHIPARFYLDRTFLVNKGGYLKRTVWLIEHFGNQYELSQVIPRFINNQICYYEVNAYVVGPSRDPFARTLLPSET